MKRLFLLLPLILAGCKEQNLPAFYMAQSFDLTGEIITGKTAPETLSDYGLIVSNPSVNLDEMRLQAPKSILLPYFEPRWVAPPPEEGGWGGPTSPEGTKRATFAEEDYWHIDGKRLAVTWGGTWELRYTEENAQKLVEWFKPWAQGWDGVYIDDCSPSISPAMMATLRTTDEYISDEACEAAWDRMRDSVIAGLRRDLPRHVLVGNTGPFLIPPWTTEPMDLDGVCSEEWWPTYNDSFETAALQYHPRLCVAWEWAPTDTTKIRKGKIRYRQHYPRNP